MPTAWLRPDWPAPAHIHALCTTRKPGVSQPPYDGFNLGHHVGDDPAAVQANRQALQQVLASTTPGAQAVFLQQVHGTHVCELDRHAAPGRLGHCCGAIHRNLRTGHRVMAIPENFSSLP